MKINVKKDKIYFLLKYDNKVLIEEMIGFIDEIEAILFISPR